jgi:nucleoside-diphosphate-sugar epimerase
MKVLVTGSSGFIGKYIVNALEKTHEVFAWTRQDHDLTKNIPIIQVDAIIHTAGALPYEDQSNILSKNILVTYNIAEFARHQEKLKHFIYISSYLVNGSGDVDEDSACMPTNLYSVCKFSCEKILENYKLPLTTLRVASVYGEGMGENTFISKCVKNIKEGNNIDIIDAETYYIHVEDLCELVRCVLAKPAVGILNAFSEKIKNVELAVLISNRIGTPLLATVIKSHLSRNISSNKLENIGWKSKKRIESYINSSVGQA